MCAPNLTVINFCLTASAHHRTQITSLKQPIRCQFKLMRTQFAVDFYDKFIIFMTKRIINSHLLLMDCANIRVSRFSSGGPTNPFRPRGELICNVKLINLIMEVFNGAPPTGCCSSGTSSRHQYRPQGPNGVNEQSITISVALTWLLLFVCRVKTVKSMKHCSSIIKRFGPFN